MVFKVKGKSALTERVNLRVTPEELRELKDDADMADISVSELVRRRYFGRPIIAKSDEVMIKEFRRTGGLLKLTHTESNGAYSSDTAAILKQLGLLIDQITKGK